MWGSRSNTKKTETKEKRALGRKKNSKTEKKDPSSEKSQHPTVRLPRAGAVGRKVEEVGTLEKKRKKKES